MSYGIIVIPSVDLTAASLEDELVSWLKFRSQSSWQKSQYASGERRSMSLVEYRSLLRGLLAIQIVLLAIGAIIVTNMHPLWMQQAVALLLGSTFITTLIYYSGVMRVRY